MTSNKKKSNPLATRLVEIRRHLELGQEEFAALMGATYRSYQRYEQGYFAPKMAHLAKLCDLGISVDWLLTGHGAMCIDPAKGIGPVAAAPRDYIDADLLGRLIDGVMAIPRSDGLAPASEGIGRIVARLYQRLAPIADEGERRGALRYALDQLRDDLRPSTLPEKP